jgi:two-component system, NarL family, sensor histidine kinase DegS
VVATGAAGSLGLEQLLGEALVRTMQITGLEIGLAYLADPNTRDLELRAHRGVEEQMSVSFSRLPVAGSPLERVLRSPGPVVLEGLPLDLPLLVAAGIRTAVLVPLRAQDSAQGLLALGTHRTLELPAEKLEPIMVVADQLGVAGDNERLHCEAGRKLEVQSRLNALAEDIMSEFELDVTMPRVLSSTLELTGADAAGIALGDPEGSRGFCTMSFVTEPGAAPVGLERALDREVVRTRRPVVAPDYRAYEGAAPEVLATGLKSAVAVPIVYGDHLFGSLSLFNFDGARVFGEGDVSVAVELGRQTGIAIENARLHQSTRFYVRQVTRAQEDERKRIARELHDETIQRLVVISRRLESLSVLSDQLPAAAQERISALEELLSETMKGVRRFVQDLRPPMLDHLGLVASVEALAADLRENNGIAVPVRIVGTPRRLGPEEELVLFRIAQEAMGNARRHSGAGEVEVLMDFAAEQVRVQVCDNGCGFVVPGRIDDYVPEAKLGLIGMKERARTLGGVLDITSRPGCGTTVCVEIPTQPVEPDPAPALH